MANQTNNEDVKFAFVIGIFFTIIMLGVIGGMTYNCYLDKQITIEAMKNGYIEKDIGYSRKIWVKQDK